MSQFTSFIIHTLITLQAVCFALPAAVPERRDICFWPLSDVTLSCEPAFENKQINGIKYSVYRYPKVPADSPYIGYVSTVLDEISPLYTSFLSGTSLAVSIHMVDLLNADADPTKGETFAETTVPLQHCYIRIATKTAMAGPISQPRSESAFKRTVAHEMYHCIQARVGTFPRLATTYKFAKWWVEGSATFMANYFYPDKSGENGKNSYNPHVPITDDEVNAYPAWIVFQYLLNSGWSVERVNTWVLKQQTSFSLGAEWSRIAADADLVAAWPHFATAFVDKSIKWKDGTAVAPLPTVPAKIITIPDAPTYPLPMTWHFFEIYGWTITLPADKTVTMTFTPDASISDGRTILQYRRGTSGPWQTAPLGRQITLQDSCQAANDPWYFIVTSTNDLGVSEDGKSHAKVSFSVQQPTSKRQSQENAYDGGIALWRNSIGDGTFSCPTGTKQGLSPGGQACCPPCAPNAAKVEDEKEDVGWACWPNDYSGDSFAPLIITPACADPSWVLWSKAQDQEGTIFEYACCVQGEFPSTYLLCQTDEDVTTAAFQKMNSAIQVTLPASCAARSCGD